jgi:hypothetical protein
LVLQAIRSGAKATSGAGLRNDRQLAVILRTL